MHKLSSIFNRETRYFIEAGIKLIDLLIFPHKRELFREKSRLYNKIMTRQMIRATEVVNKTINEELGYIESFPRFNDDNLAVDDDEEDTATDVLEADTLDKSAPTALPTVKPTMNAYPKINKWIQISSCDSNNSTIENGLQSVIPLNRCVSSVDNYQIFQFLAEEGSSISLGYKSYRSMKKCLKKQEKYSQALLNFDPQVDTAEDVGLKSITFSSSCDNNFKLLVTDSFPPIPDSFGYVESYYDSCDASDVTGYAFLPLNTCIQDDSGVILMDRKKDFSVQYTKLLNNNDYAFNVQFMSYQSSDGTCSNARKFSQHKPQFSTCVEAVKAVYDSDVAMQNLTRESYGCGNFVKQTIVTPSGAVTDDGVNDGYFDASAAASEAIEVDTSTAKEVIALSTIVGTLGLIITAILVYWIFNRNVKPTIYHKAPTTGGGAASNTTSGPNSTNLKPVNRV